MSLGAQEIRLLLAIAGLAYLAGTVPFGLLIGRAVGIDVRLHGSGNIGATNCGRVLGPKLGVAVFALDAAKGAAGTLAIPALLWPGAPTAAIATGALAALLGHCFPVWLGFRGGRGVATGVGALACLSPEAAGLGLVIWLGLVALLRVGSVASLGATACFIVTAPAIDWVRGRPDLDVRVGCYALVAGLVALRHRPNIRRLREGTELGLTAGPATGAPTEETT